MYDQELDAEFMAKRREKIIKTAFRLFSERKIEDVSMAEIAREAGCGRKTINRYFDSKPNLVVAVAAASWQQYQQENMKRRPSADFENMTAAEIFEFYLDSFLELYKNHRDLLRFNQFFNIYVQSKEFDRETLSPYSKMISGIEESFHHMYEKGKRDKTIRTDIPEQEMFLTTLHLMLASVTRYAVGLVYQPADEMKTLKELETLKKLLLREYTASS